MQACIHLYVKKIKQKSQIISDPKSNFKEQIFGHGYFQNYNIITILSKAARMHKGKLRNHKKYDLTFSIVQRKNPGTIRNC